MVVNKIGTPLVLNMFVLGFLNRKLNLVSVDSLIRAMERRVRKYQDLNKRAILEGFALE
jgi:Pyruvate/2-oxoacid:ferredoxin oxidoreductase gamma subunit